MAIIQKKTKTVIKGRPLGGAIGAYADMERKAKAGDPQAQADLKLEKEKYKTFGDGPGSGPSGAMPKPKMKMGGKMKKAEKGGSFPDLNKDGKVTKADVLVGRGVIKAKSGAALKKQAATAIAMKKAGKAPKGMKSGGSMKKCRYGCK